MKKKKELPELTFSEEKTSSGICTDPFGSYTGQGTDPFEKPVQDADDL